MANWDNCPAVERVPGWLGGAWVFADTRQPLFSLYEHLAAGETMKNFVEWYGVAKWKVEAVLNHEAKELRKARLTDEENRSVSLAAGDTKVERELEQVIPDNMRNDAGEYICPRHKATLEKCALAFGFEKWRTGLLRSFQRRRPMVHPVYFAANRSNPAGWR